MGRKQNTKINTAGRLAEIYKAQTVNMQAASTCETGICLEINQAG